MAFSVNKVDSEAERLFAFFVFFSGQVSQIRQKCVFLFTRMQYVL